MARFEAERQALEYLPPYSPDLNPIELAFAKLKALLRKAAVRTIDDLERVIAEPINQFPTAQPLRQRRRAGPQVDLTEEARNAKSCGSRGRRGVSRNGLRATGLLPSLEMGPLKNHFWSNKTFDEYEMAMQA